MAKKQPQPKKPETYEEFLAQAWSQFRNLGDECDPNVSPSNYPYRVGELVRYGNRPDCRVEEILKDGKLIHISSHDRGEVYGKPYDNARRLPILVWWMELEPIMPEEHTQFARPRIHTEYTQTSLDSLIQTIYHRGLIDSPTYQRDYVWTLDNKQKLVQSIMDRADIGKFLFLEYPYPEYRLEVVDGKQRLNAIREFYEGRFPFKGKTWFQFSRGDKHAFGDIMTQSAKLDAEKVSKADVLWLFLSINTGGVPQTEEHVAKAKRLYEEALKTEAKDGSSH